MANKLIANKVQFYMDQLGMNATELADSVPCNRSCISRLINGKAKRITLNRGMRIAELLKQPLENIFTFES